MIIDGNNPDHFTVKWKGGTPNSKNIFQNMTITKKYKLNRKSRSARWF